MIIRPSGQLQWLLRKLISDNKPKKYKNGTIGESFIVISRDICSYCYVILYNCDTAWVSSLKNQKKNE